MQVQTRKVQDVLVIDVKGQVDLSSSPKLRTAVMNAIKTEGASRVAVNLSEVSYIDSSGVATLVEGLQLARTRNCQFVLFGLTPSARQVLELARLHTVLDIRASEAEALN